MGFARCASNEPIDNIVTSRSVIRGRDRAHQALWWADPLGCRRLYALQRCNAGTLCLEFS